MFEDHFNRFKTETPPFLGRALTLRFEYMVINIMITVVAMKTMIMVMMIVV